MTIKEFKKRFPEQSFDIVHVRRNQIFNHDWLGGGVEGTVEDGGFWEIYLPHSCDEWLIGNLSYAREMVKNLEAAIDYCQKH